MLHREWRECVLCGATWPLSLHHVLNKPRDDVRGNLVMLCGSGTTGCHGLITVNHRPTLAALGAFLSVRRPDTTEYLASRLGGRDRAAEWLKRVLYAPAGYADDAI